MAKKTLVEILVHTPFTFTESNGEKTPFASGRHSVEKEVAEHWFVAAHADQTGSTLDSGGDTALLTAEIDSLKAQLEKQAKLIGEQAKQIDAKDTALGLLTAEVDSLKAAGAGANVKK